MGLIIEGTSTNPRGSSHHFPYDTWVVDKFIAPLLETNSHKASESSPSKGPNWKFHLNQALMFRGYAAMLVSGRVNL